ncbi:hypothetical protein BLA18110_02660 [Burkholderia lata]|nr:hypothetical protein BLA18110_02660 [Burkholderia lata]
MKVSLAIERVADANVTAGAADRRTDTVQKRRAESCAPNMRVARAAARDSANAEDAALWRWFAELLDDRRIRWCHSGRGWLISVDHRHVATGTQFDQAMRIAKANVEADDIAHVGAARKRKRIQ